MQVLLKKHTAFCNEIEKNGIEGLIKVFSSMGGIGRYRCKDYPIAGDKEIDIFEEEDFQGQWDFEPVLILKDSGEYGCCYFTLYCGNSDYSWFEYVYRWKGSLLKECGKIDLINFIAPCELINIIKEQEKRKHNVEILKEITSINPLKNM